MIKRILKNALPHILAISFFMIITMVYLSPVIKGKELKRHDYSVWTSANKEVADFKEKTGETSLWNNSMFGGMPMYLTTPIRDKVFGYVHKIITIWKNENMSQVFLYLIGFYIAMLIFKIRPWLAAAGAVAFAFSSYFFIIIQAGHGTKAFAIGYMAPIIAGIYSLFEDKKPLHGALIMSIFLALQIRANHFQITYYTLLAALIFGVFWFIKALKEKTLHSFGKSVIFGIVGVLLSVGVNLTSIYTTYEYGKHSIRGPSELTHNEENQTSGLDKDYATDWSYGIDETFTLLVPNFKGGASGGSLTENSKTYELFEQAQGKTYAKKVIQQLPLYWGPQPVTSGPVYVGAIVFFLFVFGLFALRGPIRGWLLAITIVSIVLSWGRNLLTGDLILYGLLVFAAALAIKATCKSVDKKLKQKYLIAAVSVAVISFIVAAILPENIYNNPFTYYVLDYLPGYNKFRTVSMTLVIAQLAIPLLGIIAIAKLFSDEIDMARFKTSLYWSAGITAGLSLIIYLFSSVFSYVAPSDAEMQQVLVDALQADRQMLLKTDAMRSFFFIILAASLIWFTFHKKLALKYFYPLLIVLLLIDMWPINKRYLNDSHFVTKKQFKETFSPTNADQYILKDVDPNFRVLNLSVSTFNDATTSHYHKSIGGYHGAKMRRYQELIKYHISPEIQTMIQKLNDKSASTDPYQAIAENKVLNMLNTKYIIASPESFPLINSGALGNAWFVNNITLVNNADEEIKALYSFNPETTIIVDKQFDDQVSGFNPVADSTASIKLKEYKPNYLKYETVAQNKQLAVFSEIYYEKGWQAYIDKKPVDHFRANYVLRSIVIPEGKHEIEFEFKPKSVQFCNTVSWASSILLILVSIGLLSVQLINKNENQETLGMKS